MNVLSSSSRVTQVCLVILGLTGCIPWLSCSPDDHEMWILLTSDPVTVNTKLEVRAADLCTASKANLFCHTDEAVTLRSLVSSDETIARASGTFPVSGDVALLETLREGDVTLTLEAEFDDGSIRSASAELKVREPDLAHLEVACIPVDSGEPIEEPYLVTLGTALAVGLELSDAGLQLDPGLTIPLSFSPEDLFTINDVRQESGRLELVARATAGAGTVTLQAGAGETTSFELLASSAITSLELLHDPAGDVGVGEAVSVYIVPSAAGRRGCRLEAMYDVTIETPTTCRLSSGDNPSSTATDWFFQLTGVQAGTCSAEVRMKGAGVVQSLSLLVK